MFGTSFPPHSYPPIPNNSSTAAGEMLCKFRPDLVYSSQLIYRLLNSRFLACLLLLPSIIPQVSLSFIPGRAQCTKVTAPGWLALHSPLASRPVRFDRNYGTPNSSALYWSSLTSSSVDEHRSSLYTSFNLSDDSWVSRPIRRRPQRTIPSSSSLALPVLFLPSQIFNSSR